MRAITGRHFLHPDGVAQEGIYDRHEQHTLVVGLFLHAMRQPHDPLVVSVVGHGRGSDDKRLPLVSRDLLELMQRRRRHVPGEAQRTVLGVGVLTPFERITALTVVGRSAHAINAARHHGYSWNHIRQLIDLDP